MIGVDGKQPGLWVPAGAPWGGSAPSALVANRVSLCRFACPRSMTITKIAFFVITAAGVDDPCDVGIYDSATSPNRLGSSGSVAGRLNATGQKIVPLNAPVALVKDQVYYAAFGVGAIGGSAAALQQTTSNSAICGFFGTTPPNVEIGLASGFPLPPAVTVTGLINVPIFALIQ